MTRTQADRVSATRSKENYTNGAGPTEGLFLALELGLAQWKLAFACRPGQKPRRRTIPGRDVAALAEEVARAKERFDLPAEAPVYSCYEAGRDAFWIHRALSDQGIENVVVDSASIEVNRRARRTKNDKLDAGKLLSMLMRYHGGETGLWSVVRVPGRQDEDVRQRQRELGALGDERNRHVNRIHALLMQQGVRVTIDQTLGERLNSLRDGNGQPLPKHLCDRIRRELDRLALVDEQMAEVEQQRRKHQKQKDDAQAKQVRQLCALRGIGPESAWLLTGELFSWRQIQNRKQLAALAGLTPSSYASGQIEHDQGISKAGNKRVRWMMTEIAWSWLNHQPDSELSQWFKRRFANASKRQRRIGIVGLARKLLVRLWHYLETGAIPEGAVLSARSP